MPDPHSAPSAEAALRVIAEMPTPEQDNMVAANMRAVAKAALAAPAAGNAALLSPEVAHVVRAARHVEEMLPFGPDRYELTEALAALAAPAAMPPDAAMGRAMQYWRDGTKLIEACLAKARKADHGDAPFPLDAAEASIWHRAQMEAYRHSLEMMGALPDVALATTTPPGTAP